MHGTLISVAIASSLVAGCGGTFPVPTQQLADTESAERSAAELGSAGQPDAQLHMQLAHEQLLKAKADIESGDNERASALLYRARSDAELAIALMREQAAKTAAQGAVDQSNTQQDTNARQGGK
jgi:hypothetical protein